MAIRAKIQTVKAPRMQRVARRPSHLFELRVRPWEIQPFMIAPVLPGETMKNLLLQSRVVTDPIKNPLIGWWCEYYWFYVKHRDLDERADLEAMVANPNWAIPAGLQSANSTYLNERAGGIKWTEKCLKRVVEEYFRYEGETWNGFAFTAPIATCNTPGGLDSFRLDSEFTSVDVDVEGPDANSTIQASEVEIALAKWQLLRMNNLTEQTYEEFLASYGVHTRAAELHVPELIRYVRDWQYPVSHIDATTGVPSSAVSWRIAERADKDRFFREPGFIFGVQVVRPKVYFSGQQSSLAVYMSDVLKWLPAAMGDEVSHSMAKFAAAAGPLPGQSNPYWVDLKDLLLYGDQFCNFGYAQTDAGMVALPNAAGTNKRYAASADADALFKSASPANQIRCDGRCDLTIMGRQQDTSGTS